MQTTPVVRGWCRNVDVEGVPTYNFEKYEERLTPKTSIVDEYHIKEYTPIGNQGDLGSCVGNGLADAVEILVGNSGQEVVQLSRLFVYWCGRNKHKATNEDSGTYINLASKAIQEHGIAPERLWEYDISKFKEQPSTEAFEAASDYKITGVLCINQNSRTVQNLVKAINADHPIVYGTEVGAEFQSYMYRTETDNTVFDAPATSLGGHCMILTGYRKRSNGLYEFATRNSWSEDWGIKGHAYLSQQYITHPMTGDFTVLTKAIEL